MSDDKRLERIEIKLDDIGDHISTIDVTLSAQHISLKEHVRRTKQLEDTIVPMRKDIWMAKGAIALIALISVIAGIIQVFKK